ncbi:RNA polymerase sigma-70 factor, ECF subfamily [Mucilaginibacter pineti]|uniref:RNA polymerase sigma-70 factor, ECF subfamily n=1 Tax=Mucilaginibacter pineti TaxID=1391627 RepID=A0A1G7AHY9_9SPHI|nr:RNA polymerase sigma-70 factor [Mucilaginibacter pineti]SDE14323.1 RNA polymerase sigma-70 factor, ECF subfamily [Mucilaginibacter pineti]
MITQANEILITKLTQGDTVAFEVLFKLYYTRLTLFANRFVNDLSVAEEIVADVFTDLWERGHETTFSTSVRSYLFKMVQNRSLNYLKHQKIENLYVSYLEKNNLFDEVRSTVESGYEEKELVQQIKAAIDTLPEKCREIFVLSRFSDLKYREIAAQLNISPKTVERQVSIALEKLRRTLKHVTYLFFF